MDRRAIGLVERRLENEGYPQLARHLREVLSRSQGRIEILDDVDAAEQHERQVVGDCDALGNGDVQGGG